MLKSAVCAIIDLKNPGELLWQEKSPVLGKTVEELTYQVRMADGEAFYLNVTHLSDNSGSGYTSLIVLIGVI